MKKLFTLFLGLVACVGTMIAESGTCGENLTWDLTDGVLTISGTGAMYDFEYDSSIGEVASPWYPLIDGITSVVISNGVTSIGARAFMRCYYVTSVSIPNSVTVINHRAFWECSSLSSITIPNSVTSIGLAAFYQCSSLTKVTIPESVTTIGQGGIFQNCTALTKVQWNAKNCTIEPYDTYGSYYYPFYGDENLVEFTFGDQVESIPAYICAKLSGLQTVHLSNSVTTVGEGAFYECNNLTSPIYNSRLFVRLPVTYEGAYSIPDGIEILCDEAFSGCSRLTSVTIPNSVTNIGGYVFQNCRGLLSVEIPNSVTEIGTLAFYYIPNIVYHGTATGAPWGARSMNGVVDGWLVYSDETKTNLLACAASAEGEIIIPESVAHIGDMAFCRCKNITDVTIPNSVTRIDGYAFYECSGLISMIIPNSVTSIEEATFLRCYALTSIELPNSITSIGKAAFQDCRSMTSMTIPNSVTIIDEYAFSLCKSLTSVTIPNSVTTIGLSAFLDCTNLTSLTIGNSVTSIGQTAFSFCNGLTSVTCLATIPPQMDAGYYYYGGIFQDLDCSQIPLYVPAGSIEAYKAADQWKDFTNILPISAQETETTKVEITTTENSVDIIWPSVADAATYELVIKDKNGNVICTLIFNNKGQLISMAFNAPSRDGAPQQTQAGGFSFTVTGLEAGTSYDLTIIAKNEDGQELDKKNISFHTDGAQGFEDLHADSGKPVKVLHDGQIYILRGEHIYDAEGKMVK